jgi:vacuolar-type H+-ATPase subunit B/Vma2
LLALFVQADDGFLRPERLGIEVKQRDIEGTLDAGWRLLSILPETELIRINREFIQKHRPQEAS